MEEEDVPQPPSKAAKLLAVAAFFMLLFFIAASVGLPVPVGLVAVFFFSAAVPLAFVVGLVAALLFRMLARATHREQAWPFFDVALQTFIVFALLSSGIFIVKFPAWVRGSYPGIRADVEKTIDPAVTPENKRAFLDSLDRFWEWNVRFLLEEGEAPSTVTQQEMRNTVTAFGQALAPDCPNCDAKLTAQEVAALTLAMNHITLGSRPSAVTDGTSFALPTGAAPEGGAVTAPPAATQATRAVTSAAP